MGKVFIKILRGLPGSGKSTYVKKLRKNFRGHILVVSADHYFTRNDNDDFDDSDDFNFDMYRRLGGKVHHSVFGNEKTKYEFNPGDIGKAHSCCMRQYICFLDAVRHNDQVWGDVLIIVDNTNTKESEIAPYYLVGQSFGHDVQVIEFVVSPEDSLVRNVHGVPAEVISRMVDNMNIPLPIYWDVVSSIVFEIKSQT